MLVVKRLYGYSYEETKRYVSNSVEQAQQARQQLQFQKGKTAQRLEKMLETFIPLADIVITQTQKRIFENYSVPTQEKIVSIFEPHTDIIVRGKEAHPIEYGHKVWLNEVGGGVVSHYRVLDDNPSDELRWEPSLPAHQKTFISPPLQVSADRGL